MNENNSMAYTQNSDTPNDDTQINSVYAQGASVQDNPAPTPVPVNNPVIAQDNAVRDSMNAAQYNAAQDSMNAAQANAVQGSMNAAQYNAVQSSMTSVQANAAQDSMNAAQYNAVQSSMSSAQYNAVEDNIMQNNTAPAAPNNPVYLQKENPSMTYNNTPLLQLNDLCKRYPGMGTYMSVFHLNLIIPRGRIIGLLGPNGCGKTTLIKMINGLLAPTSGNVLINGMEPCPATKKVISYLPERTYLDNGMKVSQMVSYFADFYEDFSTEKAYGMLGALGISSDARLKTLSKGTKEKVQLILVMSRQADLYILDEPIAGVDPAARDYILRTIITNYNPGSTIILSTHLISDIENILDDVIFMKNGSLMLYTSVDSIRSQMGKSVDTYFREVYAC